ncbi:5'-nucleotidase C-terminal domain-containing protein [Rubeoparvulum massiliense]|uniref:5'-nucleotidase C-terminal domain-containing protein n=1 Tax=Rubeoparvulum massiliense TaxID=1631346 RepID=UPI000975C7BF|nr:5'-nucleotidase C-terminal domain-containing protein [Rubeoparvulum massiliense]
MKMQLWLKRALTSLLALALVFTFTGLNAAAEATPDAKAETTITILHTNDVHARVGLGNDEIGLSKVATLVKQYREENPNLLLLDAGDAIHGQTIATIERGESIVRFYNALGYDALTAGNHDFNYGYERLLELTKVANFPVLGANVEKDGKSLLTPYVIKELDGIKVAIFGLSTPETKTKTHPKNVEGVEFTDPVAKAEAMVKELEGKADVIIALVHLGADESSEVTSKMVAEKVKGIDVIVDGHSHQELNENIGDALLVQAGYYGNNLGVVTLTFQDKKLVNKVGKLITKEETADVAVDPEVKALIEETQEAQKEITSKVVGKLDVHLEGTRELVRTSQTNLGTLITDAMLDLTGAEVAITNGGGIRASIEPGEITMGQVQTVLPFGNYIVSKKVKGADILAALEHGISDYPATKGAFPQVGGMKYTFDASKPAGSRIVEITVNGEPLDVNKEYLLATNDFMAYGGDGYTMLGDSPLLSEHPALDEAVIAYLGKQESLQLADSPVTVINNEVKEEPVVDAPVTEPAPVEQPVVDQPTVEQPAASTVEQPSKPEVKKQTYIIKSGDVLWKIAHSFGTTWQELAKWNNLKNPHLIFPGQQLFVPAK